MPVERIILSVHFATSNKNGALVSSPDPILIVEKERGFTRYIVGGILFGLGWALAGACPGPMFVLVGKGVVSILVVIFGATLGAFLYGYFKEKLPH